MVNNRVTAVLHKLHADAESYISLLAVDLLFGELVKYFNLSTWARDIHEKLIYAQTFADVPDMTSMDMLLTQSGEVVLYDRYHSRSSVRIYEDVHQHYCCKYHNFYDLIIAAGIEGGFHYDLVEHPVGGIYLLVNFESDDIDSVILHCVDGVVAKIIRPKLCKIYCYCGGHHRDLYILGCRPGIGESTDIILAKINSVSLAVYEYCVLAGLDWDCVFEFQMYDQRALVRIIDGKKHRWNYYDLDGNLVEIINDHEGGQCVCSGNVIYKVFNVGHRLVLETTHRPDIRIWSKEFLTNAFEVHYSNGRIAILNYVGQDLTIWMLE